MSTLKSVFSKLFERKNSENIRFSSELSSQFDIFHYLNYAVPDLQIVKLSLNAGQQARAFEQLFRSIKTRHVSKSLWSQHKAIVRAIQGHYPDTASDILDAAQGLRQHQFRLFANYQIESGPSINWNASYEHSDEPERHIWPPGKSYSRSQLLSDTGRDVRFVWNFNRHQHFLDLGKAYWLSGQEDLAQEFVDNVTTWIEQNPYRRSVNWVDSYEMALRGIFWVFGYYFFFASEVVDEDFFCRYYHSLFLQAHTVQELIQSDAKSLETHHLVASAAFLYTVGTVFPEYLQSKALSKFGWEILQWHTDMLTLDHIVQESLASLLNIIELYCIVLLVRRNHRYHIPQDVLKGLTTMLHQVSLFVKPNGNLTRVGEHHPVQLLRGMYSQSENFQYAFSLAAVLLHDQELKSLGRSFDESLFWFLGVEGEQEFERLTMKPLPQQSYLAPNRSYAVMRSGWDQESGYCIISNSPFKSKRGQRFKHSDLLSVEVYANGHELLIDAGPYSLQDEDEWNQYFCSMYAHNGITVDRIKHLDFTDQGVRGESDIWVSNDQFDLLSGYHTGFEELDEPVTHRRSLFYRKPGYWIMCDLLTGEGQHYFDQYFHFSPLRLHVDFANKGVSIKRSDNRRFTLAPIITDDLEVAILTGGDTPDSGWISDGYKHRVKAPFMKYEKRARVPTAFYTLFYAYNSEHPYQIEGRQLHVFSEAGTPLLSEEVSAVEMTVEQETHQFVLLHKPVQHVRFDQVTFCGQILFMRRMEERLLELVFHQTTLLKIGDRVIFQCDTPVDGFSLRMHDDVVHVACSGTYTFRTQLSPLKEMFVNDRKVYLKPEKDMIVITTSRV